MQFSSSHCGLLGNADCGLTSNSCPLIVSVVGAQHRGVPSALSTTPSFRKMRLSDLADATGSQVFWLFSEDFSTSIECQGPAIVLNVAPNCIGSSALSFLQDNNHTRTRGMYNSLFILLN